jgi:hypothetical protein
VLTVTGKLSLLERLQGETTMWSIYYVPAVTRTLYQTCRLRLRTHRLWCNRCSSLLGSSILILNVHSASGSPMRLHSIGGILPWRRECCLLFHPFVATPLLRSAELTATYLEDQSEYATDPITPVPHACVCCSSLGIPVRGLEQFSCPYSHPGEP